MKSASATSPRSSPPQEEISTVSQVSLWSGSTDGFFLSLLIHGAIAAIILLGAGTIQEKLMITPSVIQLVGSPQGSPESAAPAALDGVVHINVTISKPSLHIVAQDTAVPVVKPSVKPHPRPVPPHKPSATHPHDGGSKPVSYAEFISNSPARPTASPTAAKPVQHIDTENIRNGLIGTASANDAALGQGHGTVRDAYIQLFRAKLRGYLSDRPGVGAGQVVEVELHLLSDGSITRVRVVKSSGNAEFDQLAKESVQRISMPPRPPGVEELLQVPIKGIDAN